MNLQKNDGDDRMLPTFKRATSIQSEQKTEQASENFKSAFYSVSDTPANVWGFSIFFADGRVAYIQYQDLVSPLRYDGSGLIELSTPLVTITISGRNLKDVFFALTASRLKWMKEPDSSFPLKRDNEPEIESIKIEERL